jgi:hypothetical protein
MLCDLNNSVILLLLTKMVMYTCVFIYFVGVDYGNYMHRVSEEYGGAPHLSTLYSRSWKSVFAYTQGQAHSPLFRLNGPYKSEKCWEIVENELYDVCMERGVSENAGLVVMNAMFLGINVSAYFLEMVYCHSIGYLFNHKFRGFVKYN